MQRVAGGEGIALLARKRDAVQMTFDGQAVGPILIDK
jgi:hypothetical protein